MFAIADSRISALADSDTIKLTLHNRLHCRIRLLRSARVHIKDGQVSEVVAALVRVIELFFSFS